MKRTNLEMVLKGLDIVREAIVAEIEGKENVHEVIATYPDKEDKVVDIETKKAPKKELVDVKEKASKEASEMDFEKLSYNELKKMAKDLGLSAKGTKAELLARVQEANGVEIADEEDEDEIDEEVETTKEEVVEGGEIEETLHDNVEADLEEYTDEELKDILKSIGKSTKGKRQTLIAKIVQAIEDGELDFGGDDEEDEDEIEETETTDTEEDVEEETESDDEDEEEDDTDEVDEEDEDGIDMEDVLEPLDRDQVKAICRKLEIKVLKKDTEETLKEKVLAYEDDSSLVDVVIELGYVDLSDEVDEEDEEDEVETLEPNYIGSKARIKAMKKVYKSTLEDIEDGTIKAKTVDKFLKAYHNDTWKGTKDENNLEYARIQAELVDDDGDQVELEEAYYVGDDTFCCGAKLKEVDGDLYCEKCGTTYEV